MKTDNSCIFCCLTDIDVFWLLSLCNTQQKTLARHGGAEVAGWTFDRKIRVRFPASPHRVRALWWQGGKKRFRTSRCPCRGRLGTLKTPSCPWRGRPAAGQNLETGHLSRHYIAEISLNVTLNYNQQQQQQKTLFLICHMSNIYLYLGSMYKGPFWVVVQAFYVVQLTIKNFNFFSRIYWWILLQLDKDEVFYLLDLISSLLLENMALNTRLPVGPVLCSSCCFCQVHKP